MDIIVEKVNCICFNNDIEFASDYLTCYQKESRQSRKLIFEHVRKRPINILSFSTITIEMCKYKSPDLRSCTAALYLTGYINRGS